MWTKYNNIEVILICFLSFIPWPAPSVFKISCSRDSARVVRKIVQTRWLPILEKYQVKLPLECPFHPLREIFAPQQAAKTQNRRNQWTCNLCGKSFFEEKFLDMHFDARHSSVINSAEDAVCLSNYCDIMRCKVLLSKDSTLSFGESTISTDVELWNEATAFRTSMSSTGPRSLAKLPNRHFLPSLLRQNSDEPVHSNDNCNAETNECLRHCDNSMGCDRDEVKDGASDSKTNAEQQEKKANPEESDNSEESDCNATSSGDETIVDSSLPPVDKKKQRITEFQRMKANCKPDELEQLQQKCQMLVRDCVAGLLVQLSNDDFKAMEDELNRAVCWYLTCDRYFEDGPIEQRAFPWGLVFILVLLLSFGVCFCYYIIWILFDSDDHMSPPPTMPTSNYMQSGGHMSPTHHHIHNQQQQQQQQQAYHQSHYTSGTITPLLHTTHHPHPTQSHLMGQQQQQQQQHHQHHNPSASMSNIPVSVSVNPMPTSRSTTPAGGYPDEFYTAHDFNELSQSEHYIYVTYPPELKRRLLESCYNRTTRL
ncbi:uncharacterized protein LOC129567071 isoform X3 [Sitodiplosis mosellana]|uniref:uncharacterized protein LOC129567071 isoform X3 n=1 Tax=Sitodiplosis mosellana TaxID=263140 RepID=UPI002445281E|nr:uncharacterized protein LOC129567071 isoform X3 [Sitodiplosis mosellana]